MPRNDKRCNALPWPGIGWQRVHRANRDHHLWRTCLNDNEVEKRVLDNIVCAILDPPPSVLKPNLTHVPLVRTACLRPSLPDLEPSRCRFAKRNLGIGTYHPNDYHGVLAPFNCLTRTSQSACLFTTPGSRVCGRSLRRGRTRTPLVCWRVGQAR